VTTTLPEPSAPAGKREKKRLPPKKVRTAIAALNSGAAKTITDAAALAGISRPYLSRSMGLPHVAEYARAMSARTIALASGRAAAVKVDLLDCESSHVRNDASTFVLGVAGIQPVQTNVNLNFNGEMPRAGWVLDIRGRTPPPEPSAKIIDITPTQPRGERTTP
jgi:hypothetical protein